MVIDDMFLAMKAEVASYAMGYGNNQFQTIKMFLCSTWSKIGAILKIYIYAVDVFKTLVPITHPSFKKHMAQRLHLLILEFVLGWNG